MIDEIANCFSNSHGPDRTVSEFECIDRAESRGMILVERGDGRVVMRYPADDRVYKFTNAPWGSDHNLTEAKIWSRVEEAEGEDVFAEVYDVAKDGSYLEMEYIPLEGDIGDKEAVQEKLTFSGWRCEDVVKRNIRRRIDTGERVLVDYGDGCERLTTAE